MTAPIPKPMDPDRIAEVRRRLDSHSLDRLPLRLNAELLADRDHWQAEAVRWRDRCTVARDDVLRADVCRERVIRWLGARGWAPSERESTHRTAGQGRDYSATLTTWRSVPRDARGVRVPDEEQAWSDIADAVRTCAHHFSMSPWDVLDEMAAMEVDQ